MDALSQAGLTAGLLRRVDAREVLLRVERSRADITRIHVISSQVYPNFGDRLGFHVLPSVLPSDAVVRYSTFTSIGETADCDLVILGLGNSVFPAMGGPVMRDMLRKARHCIGIFGTQFRTAEDIAALAPLLDTLDHW